MESQNPNPNNFTQKNQKKNKTLESQFRFNLDKCIKRKDLSTAISLFESAISHNIHLTPHHFNSLLYICSCSVTDPSSPSVTLASPETPAIELGFRIFDQMLSNNINPTEATITAVARLAVAKGDVELAFELVKTMEKYKILPKLRSYDPALYGFCSNLDADKAYEVEEHMGVVGVRLEEPEVASLLKLSSETRRNDRVYRYLHKLRSDFGCVCESTAEIIENWFRSRGGCEVGLVNWDVGLVEEAILGNGGGWHGKGWLGNGDWKVSRTRVDSSSGCCCCCGEKLVCVDVDRVETEKFAKSIAALAMEREVKANFSDFQKWLDSHAHYDAIVDGANIGLYQQNFADGGFSLSQLQAVVEDLCKRNQMKSPLVVLHNRRFRELLQNSSNRKLLEDWVAQGVLYATPNGSNDDWYWLYAAIKLKCLLVTNDEMRDHIFELLGSSFFLRWKERHQVRYTFPKGNLSLQMPPVYSLVIQESEKGWWHVPISTGENTEDESSRNWICITRPTPPLNPCVNSTGSCQNGGELCRKRKERSPSPPSSNRSAQKP